MTQPTDPLRFERRPISDPLVAELLERYIAEIAGVIDGFDPAGAAPPEAADFDPPAGVFLVGFAGAEPVACGGIRRLSGEVAEIRRMWVSPMARGKGYGAVLLRALEDEARAARYETVQLDTHGGLSPALALYTSAGYLEIERYNDNAFAQHFFAKQL
jgi:GNAT superfamily N-acetyltransferase